MPDGQAGQGYPEFRWSVRARLAAGKGATVYARNQAFVVEQAASFREADPNPSALEYLLGALLGDLLTGFATVAERQGLVLDGLEGRASGYLSNPLVYLGVIGEEGHPGLGEIDGHIYVSADATEEALQEIWQTVQERSPVLNTLKRGISLKLALKITL